MGHSLDAFVSPRVDAPLLAWVGDLQVVRYFCFVQLYCILILQSQESWPVTRVLRIVEVRLALPVGFDDSHGLGRA